MRFDLADLQLFLNIADARSITGGARHSNLSLASASERVRGMEKALGERLFDRNHQGVVLTPAGACLLEHARLVIQQVARMRGDLAAFARGQAGTVRLLTNTAAIAVHLPRVLASFLASHPSISIEIEERESIDITEAVASGAADVGVASEAAFSDTVKGFAFCEDQLVVAMPRSDALVRSRRLRLMDLLERDFVTTARESALQCHIAAHAARLGAKQRVRARLNDFDAICGMVAAGVGIAIVPEVSARRAKRHLPLEVARLMDPWASRRLAVCVRDVAALPAGTRQLVDHLRAAAPISR
jgi:DNA-binding transcriptional LysR family regulator